MADDTVALPEIEVTPATPTPVPTTGDGSPPVMPTTVPVDPTQAVVGPQNTSRFPDSEIAVLVVNGVEFSDWESVWVQYRWHDSFNYFRFIAAERTPPPADWPLLQFRPDQSCQIFLAGQEALNGRIVQRQASYDANRHQVQLVGKSWSHLGYQSSVDEKPGSYDGMKLEDIFKLVLSKYPNSVPRVIGTINPMPFAQLQNEFGETTWDFIERIARPRGAKLGTDVFGNYLLIGDHAFPLLGVVKEGLNIKACECVISHDGFFQIYDVDGHAAGNDQSFGATRNEIIGTVMGKLPFYAKKITPAEQPLAGGQGEAVDRAYNEAKWNESDEIIANITVYGWTYDGKHLWQTGQNVMVDSPMAMLNMVLTVRTATFEQNNQTGTTTTLELVAPWVLNEKGNFNVGNPNAPVAPVGAPGIGHA